MKTILKLILFCTLIAITFSSCVVRERVYTRHYVQGHYEPGYYHEHWVAGHYS
jgi:hypothetical protein